MRNISFQLTAEAIRHKTKRVTRRIGWLNVKRGEQLQAVVKSQGLKKGERIERLCVIEVTDVKRERLDKIIAWPRYGLRETRLEGFPHLTRREFVKMFCEHNKCDPHDMITRIEFGYVLYHTTNPQYPEYHSDLFLSKRVCDADYGVKWTREILV